MTQTIIIIALIIGLAYCIYYISQLHKVLRKQHELINRFMAKELVELLDQLQSKK